MTSREPVPTSTSKQAVKKRTWRRARIYFWSLAIVVAMWIGAGTYTIRHHPDRFVDLLLEQLPFTSSRGDVWWLDRNTLEIDQLKLGKFFTADALVVTATPFGLFRHHVKKIQLIGAQVYTTALGEMMDQPSSSTATGESAGLDWTIGELSIDRSAVLLQDMAPGLSVIPVRLGSKIPLVFKRIRLDKPDDSLDMTREQRVDIDNVNLMSPYDPLAPVLAFPLIRLRFTYAELWHHTIREVQLISPTIYLGEDLFAFTSEFGKESAAAPDTPLTDPWQVKHFEVQYGRLALNTFGQPAVIFPFFFQTRVDDIRLDQLDKISVKSRIPIDSFSKEYPDYKVDIVNLTGELNLNWPPSNEAANNVVSTVHMEILSWNEIPIKDAYATVTFDPTGMYAKIGGACEGGYINGNVELYYTKGFNWNIDLFVNHLNVRPVAGKLAGKYIDLTGTLEGKLAVQGKVTDILDCHGSLSLPKGGVLEVKSFDDMLKEMKLPLSMKDQGIKLAIESFRTYPYKQGELNIAYKPDGGKGTLKLTSPEGRRQFDIYWHPYEAKETSRVAKEEDNQ